MASSPAFKKEETLVALQEHLDAYFHFTLTKQAAEIGLQPDTEAYNQFNELAQASFQEIIKPLQEPNNSDSTSHIIQLIHRDTTRLLVLLRKSFANPNLAPQVYRTKEGKWCVIRPAPLLENMALSGGGPRGVSYVSVFEALEAAGALSNMNHIAGTSVGAVTSTLVACGLDAAELALAADIPMLDALTSPEPKYSSSTQQMSSKGIFKGTYISEVLQKEISASIHRFFETDSGSVESIFALKNKGIITGEEARKILNFRSFLLSSEEGSEVTNPPMITFADLAILRKINPAKFKQLTIVGFNATQNKPEYYNAMTSPDMPLVDAVRVSISLPGIFTPPTNGAGDFLYDGGFVSPIPAEIFSHEPPEKTVLFGFSRGHTVDNALYQPKGTNPHPVLFAADQVSHPLFGRKASETIGGSLSALHNAGPNAFNVPHSDLTGVSFLATPDQVKIAQLQASARAWEWVAARQHQARYAIFDDLYQAFSFMRDEELESICQNYAPRSAEAEGSEQEERSQIFKTAQEIIQERAAAII